MASPNELSFLPDDYLQRKMRRRTMAIFIILLLAVGAGLLSAGVISHRGTTRLMADHEQIDARYRDEARRIEQVQKLQEKQRKMARQAELTASLLEKVPRSNVLAAITNSLPAGVSLVDFNLESKARVAQAPSEAKTIYEQKKKEMEAKQAAAAGPQIKHYDVGMKLTGMAANDMQVATFLRRLGKSPLFTDVNLVISDEFAQGDLKLRKFTIEMNLNPNAEARPDSKFLANAADDEP
jgi:hypothetical protein